MKVTLDHTHQENYNVRTFWFKKPRGFKHTAGQFIEMTLPHEHPDERGIKHWFTLSSSPTEEMLSITTKYFEDKASTFKKTLFNLKPGGEVQMSDPMGDFVLPKDSSIPLVFVAGGIGITPFRSIIKWLVDAGEQRKLQVILGAHTKKDLVFLDLFKKYGVEPILAVDGQNQQGLSAEFILDSIGKLENKLIYVSGPEPMVEAINDDLYKHGMLADQFVGDFFPGYSKI